MKKKVIKLIPYIIIAILLIIALGKVYADYLYASNNIYYNNSGSSLNASDVQGAIDELYNKCETALNSSDCPEGHYCTESAIVVYNSNDGIFTSNETINTVYYKKESSSTIVIDGTYEESAKSLYAFASWNTKADGSGTSYSTEDAVINSITNGTSTTLYAQYNEITPICKRATTLHTETCSQTSSYCYADGYYSGGSQNTSTITYGQLGTIGSEPSPGDAFDCDINGDGVYNASTERFYYVSPYFDTNSKTFNSNYYVFIYYSNTYGSSPSTSTYAWYSGGYKTSYGPTTAIVLLPTTSGTNAWRDDLLKTTTRDILYEGGSIVKSNFSYEGYAARLLTAQELRSACPNASTSDGSMSNCNYFFEQTKYSTSSYAANGSWLESAYSTASALNVSSGGRTISNTYTSYYDYYGVRPAIEVFKFFISY